ncbi:MAG: hypothetical protein ACYDCL_00315 [Myxococcales bacterium]
MSRGTRLLLCLLALPGCSSAPALSGSVSGLFPLDFNQTAVFVNSQGLELDYYLVNAGSEDLVIELAVDLTGEDFRPGVTLDLGGEVAPGQPRATVVHQVAGEAMLVLPPIANGSLTLSGGGSPGQLTSGSFILAFGGESSQLGGGRTLSGNFSALAQGAAFPTTDGGIPGETCTGGSCCATPCDGGCCLGGEACIGGACCASPCGTSCCGPTSVCFTDASGNPSCVPQCSNSSQCQPGGNCCAPIGAVSGCIPAASVTAQTQCACTQQTDCSSGCCAPALDSAGDPVGPFVCKADDGALYDCCNGPQGCAQGCCAAYTANGAYVSNVCVTLCTPDGGECGSATCLSAGNGWSYPGTSTCNTAQPLCAP